MLTLLTTIDNDIGTVNVQLITAVAEDIVVPPLEEIPQQQTEEHPLFIETVLQIPIEEPLQLEEERPMRTLLPEEEILSLIHISEPTRPY